MLLQEPIVTAERLLAIVEATVDHIGDPGINNKRKCIQILYEQGEITLKQCVDLIKKYNLKP